jgi:DNA-binding transcriptional LysR family regulator
MRDTDIRFGRNGLVMTHQSRPYHGEPATTEYRENESMESDLLALQSSDSVIILPGCSAENIRHNLVTVPLLDEELTHSIILLYRKDSVNSTIQRFLEIVGQYLEGQHSEAALSVQ